MSQNLKEILKGEVYLELRAYLEGKLKELKDIDSIKDMSTPTAQAIELKAQRKAYQRLQEILMDIIVLGETEIKEPAKGNDYGL